MQDLINIYCERVNADFWAEPLNAVTNIAFLIGALGCLWHAYQKQQVYYSTIWLCFILASIGLGSFLFHSYATRWALLADVIPILIFQLSFLLLYSLLGLRYSWYKSALLCTGFIFLILLFGQMPRQWLNGSLSYAPACCYLLGFGILHYRRKYPARFSLVAAGALFCLSMMFRASDQAVCHVIPVGTHFVWHILNALVLSLCIWGYMKALAFHKAA